MSSASASASAEECVLVTGGTGLVGYALQQVTKDRAERWVFVGSSDANLLSLESTEALFAKHKPTKVVHLAARVGGLFANMNDNVGFLQDNVSMNTNILRCCHKFGVRKLVSCLSTCVFPDKVTYPITEDQLHNGPPHFSNEGYSYAKRVLEIESRYAPHHTTHSSSSLLVCCSSRVAQLTCVCVFRLYRKQHGCNFVNVIPVNVYGPNDNYHLVNAHVIPALIHKCHIAKEKGEDLVVLGTGKPLRQFVYSLDLARLFLRVLDEYDEATPIILTVPESMEISIAQAAQLVADAMEFKGKLIFDTGTAQAHRRARGTPHRHRHRHR
jgi:GDP-L-fucose synthase